jgi:hypothetical protein
MFPSLFYSIVTVYGVSVQLQLDFCGSLLCLTQNLISAAMNSCMVASKVCRHPCLCIVKKRPWILHTSAPNSADDAKGNAKGMGVAEGKRFKCTLLQAGEGSQKSQAQGIR